jgi:lysophospholipase L1-like esterase
LPLQEISVVDGPSTRRGPRVRFSYFLWIVFWLGLPALAQESAAPLGPPDNPQWLRPDDGRLQWINVADWEPKAGGLQPVRVPKAWREKWPERTAQRALSAAGVAVRLRTDSRKVVIRLTWIEVPDTQRSSSEELWERSRPPYFDVFQNDKYLNSVSAAIRYTEQDVTVLDVPGAVGKETDLMVLFPHYYRNAEVIVGGIGVEKGARLLPPIPKTLPRVLFHGDSITHGHGVTSPRETYVWQACEIANCQSFNLGFGGTAWGDSAVAEYIASRRDWDFLVIMIGTNSFGGVDSSGKPETAGQYGGKYEKFVAIVRAQSPDKPILCITPILSRSDIGPQKNRNGEIPQDYRNAIRQAVERLQKTDRKLYLLDGLKLINDPLYLLVTDRVHPNMAGSLRMADGIAAVLKPLLAEWKPGSDASHKQ